MPSNRLGHILVGVVLFSFGGVAGNAHASERQFTYTYGSAVLPPGSLELEPWTTFRVGRDAFYSRMDNRLEFEMGVADGLQTAWYFNWTTTAQDDNGTRAEASAFTGVSSEWKLNLSDPVADAVGSSVYVEFTGGPSEFEAEAKLIFDKRWDKVVLACNVVGEHEWEFAHEGTEREAAVELTLGAAYLVSPRASIGVELRDSNAIKPGEGWEHSALFAGPTFSYAHERWWSAVTVLPQLYKLKGNDQDAGRKLVLSDHEQLEARVLFGFHL